MKPISRSGSPVVRAGCQIFRPLPSFSFRICASVLSAVMDILGEGEADELMEIAGSDMNLDMKVDVLMQLYPGRVAED